MADVVKAADKAGLRLVRFQWCGNDGTVRAKASSMHGLAGRVESGIGVTVAMQAMNGLDQLQPVTTLLAAAVLVLLLVVHRRFPRAPAPLIGMLAAAAAVDAEIAAGTVRSPLAGVPVAIKDNIATSDMPTTCASRILEGWRPPYDATVVGRLRAAGLVPLGKTNLDEFAMGGSNENSAYGVVRNPWDATRVPGGSGGGSAAATASSAAVSASRASSIALWSRCSLLGTWW